MANYCAADGQALTAGTDYFAADSRELTRCNTWRITSSLCAPTSGYSPMKNVGTPLTPF